MAGNVNIKVTADVSQAQQQLKLVDQQAQNIGNGGIGLDTNAKAISEALKPMIDAQEKFLSSFNKTIKEFSISTLGITIPCGFNCICLYKSNISHLTIKVKY